MWRWTFLLMTVALAGCQFVPRIARTPEVRNPFPQLSKVAVVEFFNGTTDDTTVDGLQFAVAYASELQRIPGFEVIPPDIVRAEMRSLRMLPEELADPGRRRLLAESLGVDAIVTGIVTEFSPYYPPRLGMKVNWYAANPSFHPIPPGYGLPWGTPEEEEIPDRLVYEAELALAKEQMKTQTPLPENAAHDPAMSVPAAHTEVSAPTAKKDATSTKQGTTSDAEGGDKVAATDPAAATDTLGADLPEAWPDPRGFIPPPPSPTRPPYLPSTAPVMTHTRMYHGHDADVTAALQNFYQTRDEARFGGWQSYLQRSDDFIRFCCHSHIAEMLTARGGAGKTRVLWRWPDDR